MLSAHVIFPQTLGVKNVLVPIGLDEDTHLRASRDVVEKFGYEKVSVLHGRFLPGMDGRKMSKSKGNAVYLLRDSPEVIRKKVSTAFSGGRSTVQEHKLHGGIPEIDISYIYLRYLFYNQEESKRIYNEYKAGKILSGEMKNMLMDAIMEKIAPMRERLKKMTVKEMASVIMKNEDTDVEKLIEDSGVMSEELAED